MFPEKLEKFWIGNWKFEKYIIKWAKRLRYTSVYSNRTRCLRDLDYIASILTWTHVWNELNERDSRFQKKIRLSLCTKDMRERGTLDATFRIRCAPLRRKEIFLLLKGLGEWIFCSVFLIGFIYNPTEFYWTRQFLLFDNPLMGSETSEKRETEWQRER